MKKIVATRQEKTILFDDMPEHSSGFILAIKKLNEHMFDCWLYSTIVNNAGTQLIFWVAGDNQFYASEKTVKDLLGESEVVLFVEKGCEAFGVFEDTHKKKEVYEEFKDL